MSILSKIEFGSFFDDVSKVTAVINGLGDAYYDPLPHASADYEGEISLAVPFVVERVNERLTEPLSAGEVVYLLTLFGFELYDSGHTALKVVQWNDALMAELLDALFDLQDEGSVVAQLTVAKVQVRQWPPRYRKLKDMPLSDEQRAFVAEWLDSQLALVREYLLRE